jgi:hypothetical protein
VSEQRRELLARADAIAKERGGWSSFPGACAWSLRNALRAAEQELDAREADVRELVGALRDAFENSVCEDPDYAVYRRWKDAGDLLEKFRDWLPKEGA